MDLDNSPDMFTIYHFSDPHFGVQLSDSELHEIQSRLLKKFLKKMDEGGLRGHDRLVFYFLFKEFEKRVRESPYSCLFTLSGDITAFGSRENIQFGNFYLQGIRNLFAGRFSKERSLFLTMGNHDILTINGEIEFPFHASDFNLAYFGNNNGDVYPRRLEIIHLDQAMIFFALNSVDLRASQNLLSVFGRGRVEETQLGKVEEYLAERGGLYRKKIVMLHHSPLHIPMIANMEWLELANGIEFIVWLYGNKIDMVLCGHLHRELHINKELRGLLREHTNKSSPRNLEETAIKILIKRERLSLRKKFNIKGKYVAKTEAAAFAYLEKMMDRDLFLANNWESLGQFYIWLKAFPEYFEFIEMVNDVKKEKMRIVIAGTACQLDSKAGYGYWEIKMDLLNNEDIIYKNMLDPKSKRFFSRTDSGN